MKSVVIHLLLLLAGMACIVIAAFAAHPADKPFQAKPEPFREEIRQYGPPSKSIPVPDLTEHFQKRENRRAWLAQQSATKGAWAQPKGAECPYVVTFGKRVRLYQYTQGRWTFRGYPAITPEPKG